MWSKTPCLLSWLDPQEPELVEGGGDGGVCEKGVCVAGTEATGKQVTLRSGGWILRKENHQACCHMPVM